MSEAEIEARFVIERITSRHFSPLEVDERLRALKQEIARIDEEMNRAREDTATERSTDHQ